MIRLRLQVDCLMCADAVDKNMAIAYGPEKYVCFDCYKQKKSLLTAKGYDEKIQLYCERCRYKFTSKRFSCPYCSKADKVGKANISVQELL